MERTEEGSKPAVAAVDFLKVTELAAIESARWLGRGDNHSADQAAVDAMRAELGDMPITGTVVIGEGQKDEAPELYVGEVLAASIRSPHHVVAAAQMGSDIATIPPKVFYQMLQHPLTTAGIASFEADAEARLERQAKA